MKKLGIGFLFVFCAAAAWAHDHDKSCDMNKAGQKISVTGKVTCKSSGEDCTFQTADAKTTYTVCEMSKADLPKLSASGATITATGKLITCEGKEKLLIEKVGE